MEFLSTNLNPCHPLLSLTPDVCFVSQLKRCFNVSLPELILSTRSSRRSIPVEFLSVDIVLDEDIESKDVKNKMLQGINIFEIVLALCPLCLLTPLLESRDEILVL